MKRIKSNARVVETAGEAEDGTITLSSVPAGIASVSGWTRQLSSPRRGKRKAGEQERNEEETEPPGQLVNGFS